MSRSGSSSERVRQLIDRSIGTVLEQLENRTMLAVDFSASPKWTEQGPGPTHNGQTAGLTNNPVAGAINQVLPFAGNANTYFVATVNGGVWRSTNVNDANPSWQPLTDQEASLSTAAIAFDPNHANTLYVGIGRTSSGGRDGGPLTGLLRTTGALDATPRFTPVGTADLSGKNISLVQVGRRTTAGGAVILAAGLDGMYLSEDDGNAFTLVSGTSAGNLPVGRVTDLVVDRSGGADTFYAAVAKGGIFTSADGKTWTSFNKNLTAAQVNAASRIRLALHNDASNKVVYAAVANGGALNAVYRSNNGGNWAAMGTAPAVNPGGQGADNHLSLAADPNNANIVYVGGDRQANSPYVGNLFIGNASTNTWNPIVLGGANGTAPHADSRNLVFDTQGNLVEADDGGVYRLADPPDTNSSVTRQWKSLNGNLRITEFYSVAYDHVNNLVYGGAQDVGVPEQTIPGGFTFDEGQTGQGDGSFVGVAYPDATHSIHYTATQSLSGLKRRTFNDNGTLTSTKNATLLVTGAGGKSINSQDANQKLVFDTFVDLIEPYYVNAVDPNRVLVGTRFLYESTDGGDNFTAIDGLTDLNTNGNDDDNDGQRDEGDEFVPKGGLGGFDVQSAAYGGRFNGVDAPQVAYIGLNGAIRLRDTVGGAFNPLPNYHGSSVTDIALDPDNWKTAYVIDYSNRVWRTTDAGANWQQITGNLGTVIGGGNNALRTIEVFPGTTADGDEVVLVGGQGGVYRSTNPSTGTNAAWAEFGTGLPNTIVSDLHYDRVDDVLVAGTVGRSIWTVAGTGVHVVNNSVLTIDGTGANDNIVLIRNKDNPSLLEVTVNGVNPDPSVLPVQLNSINKIVINTFDGNDTVTVDEANGEIETSIDFNGGSGIDHLDRIHNPSLAVRIWRGFTRGLSRFGEWVGRIFHASDQSQNIPVVNQKPGEVLNGVAEGVPVGDDPAGPEEEEEKESTPNPADAGFVGAFQKVVVNRLLAYLAADSTPTPEEFARSLGNISGEFNGIEFEIDPSSITTTVTTDALQFNVDLHAESTRPDVLIDFSTFANSLGLSFAAGATIDFTAGVDFHLGLGVDLAAGLEDDERFFIVPQAMSITGKAHTDDLSTGVSLGLLKAQVSGGTFDVDAGITASFSNPDGDAKNRLTLSELFGNDITSLVHLTPSVGLSASLPASASVSGLSVSGLVTINDTNLLDDVPPQVTATGFDDALSLKNITPQGIINALSQLGQTLNSIAAKLNIPGGIPFISKGIDQLVNLVDATNDFASRFYDVEFDSATGYSGAADPATSFKLTKDAHFKVKISDDADTFDVTVTAASTSTNASLDDLVADVTQAIHDALPDDLQGKIVAFADGTRLRIQLSNPEPGERLILRYAADDDGMHELGFQADVNSAVFKFDSLESLSALLAQLTGLSESTVNLRFVPANKQLLFHLTLPAGFDTDLNFDFTKGLGPLTIGGDAAAHFHADVALNLDLGIDLSQPLPDANGIRGSAAAPSNGRLSGDATFTITVGDEAPVTITVHPDPTNNTIQDLVADINAAITAAGRGGRVLAGADGNVITFSSTKPISITGTNAVAQSDLHLADSGSATAGLADRLFIKEGSGLSADVHFTASDLDLFAALGFVGIGVNNGTADFGLRASFTINDGDGTNGELIKFSQIGGALPNFPTLAALPTASDPTLIGSLSLPLTFSGGISPATVGVELRLDTSNTTQPLSVTFDSGHVIQNVIDSLGNLSIESIVQLILDLANKQLPKIDALNRKLPVLDKSVNELLDLAKQLSAAANSISGGLKQAAVDAALTKLNAIIPTLTLSPSLLAQINSVRDALAAAKGTLASSPTTDALSLLGPVFDNLRAFQAAFVAGGGGATALQPVFDALADSVLGLAIKKGLAQFDDLLTPTFLNTLSQSQRDTVLELRHSMDSALSALTSNQPGSFASAGGILITLIGAFQDVLSSGSLPPAAISALQPALDALKAKAPSLQRIEELLESALGLGSDGVTLGFNANKLTALVHWVLPAVDKTVAVNIATPDLGIISFTGDASATVHIGATIDLGFGLDFTGGTPTPFLMDSTHIAAEASVTGSVDLDANILGVGVHVGPGTIKLESKAHPGSPATLTFGLVDLPPDHVYTFDTLSPSSFTFAGDGQLVADLPISVGSTANVANIHADVDLNNPAGFTFEVQHLDDLLNALIGAFDFGSLIDGFRSFLNLLERALKDDVLKKLPVIGDDLDQAAEFINRLRSFADQLDAKLHALTAGDSGKADTIRDFIFNALGSSAEGATGLALGVLKDMTGDGHANADDITVNLPDDLLSASEISVAFQIGGTQHATPKFDLGLSGLGMGVSTAGGIDLGIDYGLDINLGLSRTAGFFFGLNADANDPEVQFDVHAHLADGTELKLNLFFLTLTATNHDETLNGVDANGNGTIDKGTGFDGSLALNLSTTDPSNRISVANLDATVTPSFQTDVTVNLDLVAGIANNKNLPTLSTNLFVLWGFSTDPAAVQPLDAHLYNISLDFGQFFHNTLAPFFQKFNQFVDPLRPILGVLNNEIPVISQLSQLVGGPQVTFASALQFLGHGFPTVQKLEEIFGTLTGLSTAFNSLSAGAVNFGDFDLSALPLLGGVAPQTKLSDSTLSSFFTNQFALPGGDAGAKLAEVTKAKEQGGLGIIFPLFKNPAQIVNLLFGKNVDLIQWDIPRLDADFEFNQLFGPILPPIPLFARISGSLGVFAHLFAGFDTRGFQTGDFLNGLYFGDFQNGTSGPEAPEFGLNASFSAGAELNVVVASAGVRGGIKGDVLADWNDPNHDGRFYLDEVLQQFARGVQCVFDFSGALTAFFEAFVKIGFDTPFGFVTLFSDTMNLGKFTLLDFNYTCPPLPPPVLAHVESGGRLILHTGPNAGLRQPGSSTDVAETMTVRRLGAGKFEVSGFGETQVYDGVSSIFADGGLEDDVITLDPSVDVRATLIGGAGNDQLTGGSANDNLSGNDGDDQLVGGAGNDTLAGGNDNDLLVGGAGADNLSGNDGDDQIYGAEQVKTDGDLADVIDGGAGNDNIFGASGNDTVHAGSGNDKVDGGDGNDVLFGDADADLIEGGAGADEIHGGSGNDILFGEGDKPADVPLGKGGNDTISGDADDDTITDDEGSDVIDGGTGNDAIQSGRGNDTASGGDGDDSIVAGDGADQVHGGAGDDILLGDNGTIAGEDAALATSAGAGNDTMTGDAGADLMYGQAGEDSMQGNDGSDTMLGGEDADTMRGGAGNDSMSGEGGADLMYGDANNDVMDGGAASDRIYGGLDNDLIRGQEDADYIEGGAGADTVFGGLGDDRIIGGASSLTAGANGPGLEGGLDAADSIVGDAGDDIILADNGTISLTTRVASTLADGGAGNDTVFGGAGNDIIFGGGSGDLLIGDASSGSGDDVIVGDQGAITLTSIESRHSTVPGSGGDDTATGSGGSDVILGGDGSDLLAGDADPDVIFGDNGRVLLNAGGVIVRMESLDPSSGGNDTATGSGGADVIVGGAGNDNLSGGTEDDAADILLGDNGTVVRDDGSPDANDVFTTDPDFGGADTASGGGGNDIVIGGSGGTDLVDPDCNPLGPGDSLSGDDGDDIVIGDNARITRDAANHVQRIETTSPDHGGADSMDGGAGDDIMLGGEGPDTMTGGVGNDVLLGDNGFLNYTVTAGTSVLQLISTSDPTLGCSDSIQAADGNDTVMGGTDAETIDGGAGDDLVFGDHGKVDKTLPPERNFSSIDTLDAQRGGADVIRGNTGNDILIGGQSADLIFGDAGDDDLIGGHNVAGGDDDGDALDGGAGNDVIAGDNASIIRRHDAVSPLVRTLTGNLIYDPVTGLPLVTGGSQENPTGALGRDVELFDHSTSTPASQFGDDVIAGGAQDDLIFGQLGNDTIRGDGRIDTTSATPTARASADSATDGDDYVEGNGGDDRIFGDLGQDDLIGGSSDLFGLTTPAQRLDGADVIYGGAGTDTARNTIGDPSATGHARDADVILGDNGEIFRLITAPGGAFRTFTYDAYGSLKLIPRAVRLLDYTFGGNGSDLGGDDLLHGEAGDDQVYGGVGNDVMFGEGQDDDLYGGAGHDRIYGGTGEDGVLGDDGLILTSRNGLTEPLNGVNAVNAAANSTLPGPFTGAWLFITGRLNKTVIALAWNKGGNDVIYGGLGDDFLHGGAGDDAICGAEAQAAFYNESAVINTNPLSYSSTTRKLAAYDANNPLKRIDGFFLNFDASDASGKIEDGKDRLFGDLGNDWLVGGTGNDRMFGGVGDDLMNADDNLDTAGGLNNQPDPTLFGDRDFAYGGDGLDVLIANTGGDRLFDWVGEFNSFIVPFSPFGEPTVSRRPNPQTIQFIRDLGRESGADRTRTEPDGELGLFTQGDPRWQDNTGGPRDPQAGNTKARRDTQGAPEDDRATALPLAAAGIVSAAPASTTAATLAANSQDAVFNHVLLSTDPDDPSQKVLFVGGSDADDVIQLRRGSTASKIRVLVNGADRGEFDATGLSRIVVFGNAGNDSVTVNPDLGPVTALLYGGDGNDTLTGGVGDNILDGGDGNDSLTGSSGRDILFGGAGSDSISGGSEDDVLVGGTYADSGDLTAAKALIAAWGSKSTLGYAQRIAAFLGGVDANGVTGTADSLYRLNSSNVLDDGAADVLTGATGQDWFLAAPTDRTDKKGNELLS